MSEESFHRVISEHVALAERNKRLEWTMPLESYREHDQRASAADHSALPPSAQEELSTELNIAAPRREPNSWWDASDERPLPEFEWGDN
jgi:hypothetical protein